MNGYKAMAHIHSLNGKMAEITVLEEVGDNVWTPIFAHETPGSVWGQIGVEIWPPPPPCMVLFSPIANLLVIRWE